MDHPVSRVKKVTEDFPVCKEHMVLKVTVESVAELVHLVLQALQVYLVLKVQKEERDHQVLPVKRVMVACLVLLDLLVPLEKLFSLCLSNHRRKLGDLLMTCRLMQEITFLIILMTWRRSLAH